MESKQKKSHGRPVSMVSTTGFCHSRQVGQASGLGYFTSLHNYHLGKVPVVTTYKLWTFKPILSYVNNL